MDLCISLLDPSMDPCQNSYKNFSMVLLILYMDVCPSCIEIKYKLTVILHWMHGLFICLLNPNMDLCQSCCRILSIVILISNMDLCQSCIENTNCDSILNALIYVHVYLTLTWIYVKVAIWFFFQLWHWF